MGQCPGGVGGVPLWQCSEICGDSRRLQVEEDLPSPVLLGFGRFTASLLSLCFHICKMGKSHWITFKAPSYSQILSHSQCFLTLGVSVAQEARRLLLVNRKGMELDRFGRK